MNIRFNPEVANHCFHLSAYLDRVAVKMRSLGSGTANFMMMDAHVNGIDYVDFYPGPHNPYLVATGDDRTIKS
ncbi:hypothetical protein JVU11DRAFT_2786 [Chiua virens]|nr:hypothetical protein JVU11DRAFT_2786 [Chiua virens]